MKTEPEVVSPRVRSVLSRLSLDEKIAQLLHPAVSPEKDESTWREQMPDFAPGGAFVFYEDAQTIHRVTDWIQSLPSNAGPVLISSDLESGAGRMVKGATLFPDLLSFAAARKTEFARTLARSTAREGRSHGIHWNLGPVVDINANPYNPIANTRSLGDDVETIVRLSSAMIEELQANSMAACAKHFPGDGWDDRDQHLVTSANPLSKRQWLETSGYTFRRAIEAGAWTIMIGHISLACVDPGVEGDPQGPPSAMLSRAIVTDLLRGELGFRGLILTDAMEMGGSVTRVESPRDLIVRALDAGCDMFLFSKAKRDFEILRACVRDGEVSESRIDASVARILALKERLGFLDEPEGARWGFGGLDPLEVESHRAGALEVARNAVTIVRNEQGVVPFSFVADKPVFLLHVRSDAQYGIDAFDAIWKAKGYDVVRKTELDDWDPRREDWSRYSAIVVAFAIGPTWGTSQIRGSGAYMRLPWFVQESYPKIPVVHVSFGNPYLIHEFSWAKTWINAYSPDPATLEAVVEVVVGDLPARGADPVDLDRPVRLKRIFADAVFDEIASEKRSISSRS